MDAPCITIVVPVRNRAGIVGATLASIASQTLRPLAVVLVDNDSTDGTRPVLERWRDRHDAPDFKVTVLTETKLGASNARNCGLAAAATPWVMFFDSDDIMHPNHAARVAAGIEANPDAQIIGWNALVHEVESGASRNAQAVQPRSTMCPFAARDALYRCITNGTMASARYVVRTDLIRSVGGWNAEVGLWDDIELGTRLLLTHPKVVKLSGKSTIELFGREDSITGASQLGCAERMEPALRSIETSIGTKRGKLWTDIKRAHQTALAARENRREGQRLFNLALDGTKGRRHRAVMRFVFSWTSAGRPGAMRLVRPFV